MNDTPASHKITFGAGFARRLLAHILDFIYMILLYIISAIPAMMILAVLERVGRVEGGWLERMEDSSSLYDNLTEIMVFIAYHTISEGMHGSTLGKALCRIRVISMTGTPCSMRAALIRSLGFYVDALFFGLVGYLKMSNSPLNRRHGDVWAKSLVVHTRNIAGHHQRSISEFFLGLLLSTMVTVLIVMTYYIWQGMR